MSKLGRFLASEDKVRVASFTLRGALQSIRYGGARRLDPRLWLYRRGVTTRYTSPFPADLYGKLLDRLCNDDAAPPIMPLTDLYGKSSGIVLRHDVDQPDCVRNLPAMIEAERERGLRSSVFVRVDGTDYDPADCRPWTGPLLGDGFDVGLHSVAYVGDDPHARFDGEVQRFADLFGSPPRCYNFHGLGSVQLANRLQLGVEANDILARHDSLVATDSHNGYYAYRIMDCYGTGSTRQIGSDFDSPPVSLVRGARLLVLTHPMYWGEPA